MRAHFILYPHLYILWLWLMLIGPSSSRCGELARTRGAFGAISLPAIRLSFRLGFG